MTRPLACRLPFIALPVHSLHAADYEPVHCNAAAPYAGRPLHEPLVLTAAPGALGEAPFDAATRQRPD